MSSKIRIEDDRLVISRVFDAPRQRVFDAWRQVDKLQQWWGCGNTIHVDSTVDFRVGGTFSHDMQIEGCGNYCYLATFDEIIEPEKISYHSDSDGNLQHVTVEFIDLGEEVTKLILTQEGFPSQEACQRVSEGFSIALERLCHLVVAAKN